MLEKQNIRPATMTAPALEGTNATAAKQRRRVLVCEDDDSIRDLLLDALQEEGYSVDVARNGREALEHLQGGDGRYLVLLDLLMPEITGYEILERMNADPQLRGEHVVIVVSATGFAQHPMSSSAIEKHLVRGFVKKPFDLDDLLAMVQRWI
jgi:CheY-like chemotaxis protein